MDCIVFIVTFFSRSVELKLNGGTPFEKGVELDPTVSLHSKFQLLLVKFHLAVFCGDHVRTVYFLCSQIYLSQQCFLETM